MYGNENGEIGTLEKNLMNKQDSTIKTVVDRFYEEKIKSKGL